MAETAAYDTKPGRSRRAGVGGVTRAARRCRSAATHSTRQVTGRMTGVPLRYGRDCSSGAMAPPSAPTPPAEASRYSARRSSGPVPVNAIFTNANTHTAAQASSASTARAPVALPPDHRCQSLSRKCQANARTATSTVAESSPKRSHSPRLRRAPGMRSSAHSSTASPAT